MKTTHKRSSPKAKQQAAKPPAHQLTKPVKALHQNNRHKSGYDFDRLVAGFPGLKKYLVTKLDGLVSVDFSNPLAVRSLNAALLECDYGIKGWTLPNGALCPPIPGRVDYIHHVAALIKGEINRKKTVRMLDIGTGASGIYGLLAAQQYGWQCVGSDINASSLANVDTILKQNPSLAPLFSLRQQTDPGRIFAGIIQDKEWFDVTVCNPPFHDSPDAARNAAQRKINKLRISKAARDSKRESRRAVTSAGNEAPAGTLNFGGQDAELWCNGGERLFLKRMMKESKDFSKQCAWFTSLVSKNENLKPSVKLLNKLGATDIQRIDMVQGNKKTRILAWSFLARKTREASFKNVVPNR